MSRGHDWILTVNVPVTDREVQRLGAGIRVVFKKLDVYDPSQVRGAAVFCARCEIPWARMTLEERGVCRGEDDNEDA